MRITYIDYLKGFLIFLVVLGHVVQNLDVNYAHNIVFRYIYSFHMPMFFWISGFVNFRENLVTKTIYKRFFQLIIPFFSWWFLRWLFGSDISISESILLLMERPDRGLWFLWVLFICILLLHLMDWLSIKLRVYQELIIVSGATLLYILYLVSNFRYLGFQFVSWYFMFFSIGFFTRKYEKQIFKYANVLLAGSSFSFFSSAWFWQFKGNPSFLSGISDNPLIMYGYKFGVAILGIIFLTTLFKNTVSEKFERTFFLNSLMALGQVTLGIYVIHNSFINQLIKVDFNIPYWLVVTITTLLTLMLSYVSVLLLKKLYFTRLILLGEKAKD